MILVVLSLDIYKQIGLFYRIYILLIVAIISHINRFYLKRRRKTAKRRSLHKHKNYATTIQIISIKHIFIILRNKMKYKTYCKHCRNRSNIQEKNRRDKINILRKHHRSLPWIGIDTSTKRGVVELES